MPDSARLAPTKKAVNVESPEDFKSKLKEAFEKIERSKNEDNIEQKSPEEELLDGLSGQGEEVIYCGPSGCFPAREVPR